METKNIEAFVMIVKKGSFSSASTALYISQSTISARIHNLEMELNTKLFERQNGKKIILTPQAKEIFPVLEKALTLIDGISKKLNAKPNPKKQYIISCPTFMSDYIIPELHKNLGARFPQLDITFETGKSTQIVRDVESGRVDAGICFFDSKQQDNGHSMYHIADEETVLISAPDHDLTALPAITFTELNKQLLIMYHKQMPLYTIVERFLKKNGVDNYKTMEIQNFNLIKKMVKDKQGITFCQKMVVVEDLQNKALVELTLQKKIPSTPIYLFVNNSLSKKLTLAFKEAVETIFKGI